MNDFPELRAEVHQIRDLLTALGGDIREIRAKLEVHQETSSRLPALESRVSVVEAKLAALQASRTQDREDSRFGSSSTGMWVALAISSAIGVAGIVTSAFLALR